MKTNLGLIDYAKHQLGRPYWYGTYGQLGNETVYKRLASQSFTKDHILSFSKESYEQEYGNKVHDCIGLVKGYLFCDGPDDITPNYNPDMDYSANGMLDISKEKGPIVEIPEIPGILVYMVGHVGIYLGEGLVIEARGHAYGVVLTKLKERPWKNWGKCPFITYQEIEYEEEEDMNGKEIYEKLTEYLASLPTSDYAKESSKKGVQSGLFSDGDKDGLVDNPRGVLTREQLAVVLNRAGLLDK